MSNSSTERHQVTIKQILADNFWFENKCEAEYIYISDFAEIVTRWIKQKHKEVDARTPKKCPKPMFERGQLRELQELLTELKELSV